MKYESGSSLYGAGSHTNQEMKFKGLTEVMVFVRGTLIQGRTFVQSQWADSSCEAVWMCRPSVPGPVDALFLITEVYQLTFCSSDNNPMSYNHLKKPGVFLAISKDGTNNEFSFLNCGNLERLLSRSLGMK